VDNADTIEDLLLDRYEVYTDHYKKGDWSDPEFYNEFENEFKENFIKLVKKMKKWEDSELMDKVKAVKDSPHLVQEMIQNLVIIQDQSWMDILIPYAPRFASIHVGQPYLAIPITPLCYGPKFQFRNETEIL